MRMLVFALVLAMPAGAQRVRTDNKLPGYYEFFMKAGGQQILRSERRRDRKIDAGGLLVQRPGTAMPELSLPLADGELLDFKRYRGKKHLIVVSYRAWW